VIIEDGELGRRKVEVMAGLANEVANVEVGLVELRGRRLYRGSSRRVPRGGEGREVIHRDDGGTGTRSLTGRRIWGARRDRALNDVEL